MGVVYLGVREDDQFTRQVAIKVLKRGMDTADMLRRFEQGRQLLAALRGYRRALDIMRRWPTAIPTTRSSRTSGRTCSRRSTH